MRETIMHTMFASTLPKPHKPTLKLSFGKELANQNL